MMEKKSRACFVVIREIGNAAIKSLACLKLCLGKSTNNHFEYGMEN